MTGAENERLAVVEERVSSIKADISVLKSDVSSIKGSVDQLVLNAATRKAQEEARDRVRSAAGVWTRFLSERFVAILALVVAAFAASR